MEIRGATSRHEARQIALQVLYAVELTGDDPSSLFNSLVRGGDKRHCAFAQRLVSLACRHKAKMDEMISSKSHRWDIGRMALLDHLILRIALCELFHVEDVPPKVTINEAIEIAKMFSTDQSGRFINGLLDALFEENEQLIHKIKSASSREETPDGSPGEPSKKKASQKNGSSGKTGSGKKTGQAGDSSET
ncbi:MAG: transcription antitermination factor NusB [bacterium]